MKLTRLGIGLTLLLIAVFIATPGSAGEAGLKDKSGVWRNSEYWHKHHPDWVYKYHPDWVVEREEWWQIDHEHHPEWFETTYWRAYPVWTYGAYDARHQWHSAGWWHEREPAWFYSHHPEWAEVHPTWMRADHERHAEWFHSSYWDDHHHDWNHLAEQQHEIVMRSVEAEQHHAENLIAHEGAPHNQTLYHQPPSMGEKSNSPGHTPYQTTQNHHQQPGYAEHQAVPPPKVTTPNPAPHAGSINSNTSSSHKGHN